MPQPAGPDHTAISAMTFEDALSALETIVRDLESGKAPLEQSIDAYERGMALKRHCEAKLRDAKSKIEKIAVAADGQISTHAFDEA